MSESWRLSNFNNVDLGGFRDADAAKRFADKYDRRGAMTVRHKSTGETWQRIKGSWFRTRSAVA